MKSFIRFRSKVKRTSVPTVKRSTTQKGANFVCFRFLLVWHGVCVCLCPKAYSFLPPHSLAVHLADTSACPPAGYTFAKKIQHTTRARQEEMEWKRQRRTGKGSFHHDHVWNSDARKPD